MALRSIDFIERLTRHISPHYFNAIRHFWLLGSRVKKQYKEITDRVLESPPRVDKAPNWRERQTAFLGPDPLICTVCGKLMSFVSSHIPNPLWRVKKELRTYRFFLITCLTVSLLRLLYGNLAKYG